MDYVNFSVFVISCLATFVKSSKVCVDFEDYGKFRADLQLAIKGETVALSKCKQECLDDATCVALQFQDMRKLCFLFKESQLGHLKSSKKYRYFEKVNKTCGHNGETNMPETVSLKRNTKANTRTDDGNEKGKTKDFDEEGNIFQKGQDMNIGDTDGARGSGDESPGHKEVFPGQENGNLIPTYIKTLKPAIIFPGDTTSTKTNEIEDGVDDGSGITPTQPYRNGEIKEPCLQVFISSKQEGGQEIDVPSSGMCQAECILTKNCDAATWHTNSSTCYLHSLGNDSTAIRNKSYTADECCTLYKKFTCPKGLDAADSNFVTADNITVNIVRLLDIATQPATCKANVTIMKYFGGGSMFAGSRQNGYFTKQQCKDLCLHSANCAAVDFNIDEDSCWTHTKLRLNKYSQNYCCDHFRKKHTCAYDCYTFHLGKVGVGEGTELKVVSDSHCKLLCMRDSYCVGFDFNFDESTCIIYHEGQDMNFTDNRCCVHVVKQTCYEVQNDTLILPPYMNLPSTRLPDVPAFSFPKIPDLTTESVPGSSIERVLFLSPASLVVLVGCVFVFLIGFGSLIGFIIHRKKEKKSLESDSISPTNPSIWMNEYSYAGARNNLGFWYADNPALDTSEEPVARRLERHAGYHGYFPTGREGYDFQRQRHSFAGMATTSLDDPYLEALSTFPSCPPRGLHPGLLDGVNRYPSFTCPSSYRMGTGRRLTRYDLTTMPDINNRENTRIEQDRQYDSAYP